MVEIKEIPKEHQQKVEDFCSLNNLPFDKTAVCHVVLEKDDIVGIAQLKVEKSSAEILNIFVKEEFRNMGLGDGLLKMQINYCYKNSIGFIKVKKGINDNFFKRVGFVEEGNYLVLDVQAFYANLKCSQ